VQTGYIGTRLTACEAGMTLIIPRIYTEKSQCCAMPFMGRIMKNAKCKMQNAKCRMQNVK
jgi:hypothetical protein